MFNRLVTYASQQVLFLPPRNIPCLAEKSSVVLDIYTQPLAESLVCCGYNLAQMHVTASLNTADESRARRNSAFQTVTRVHRTGQQFSELSLENIDEVVKLG